MVIGKGKFGRLIVLVLDIVAVGFYPSLHGVSERSPFRGVESMDGNCWRLKFLLDETETEVDFIALRYIVEFEIWNRGGEGFSIEFWNNDRGLILAANAVVYRSVSLAPWLGYLRVSSVFSMFARPSATPLRVFSTSSLSKSADKIEALLSNPKQTTVFITKTVHCKNVFQRALLYTLS